MPCALRSHPRSHRCQSLGQGAPGDRRVQIRCAIKVCNAYFAQTTECRQASRQRWLVPAGIYDSSYRAPMPATSSVFRVAASQVLVEHIVVARCGENTICIPLSWLHIIDIPSSQHIHACNTKAAALRNFIWNCCNRCRAAVSRSVGTVHKKYPPRGHLSRMARGRKPSQPDAPADLLKGSDFMRPPACACCLACSATPWRRLGCRYQCIHDGQAVPRLPLSGRWRMRNFAVLYMKCAGPSAGRNHPLILWPGALPAAAEALQQRAQRRSSEPAAANLIWEQAAVR